MNSAVAAQIESLETMTVGQLVKKYEAVIEEECRSRNKRYLIRRISWRLQANQEGGLSQRAIQRAEELAENAQVRLTAPKGGKEKPQETSLKITQQRDARLPPAGSFLERKYKDKTLRVLVLEDGFEYEGQRFKTLTAIANAITGSHVNGFQFFHLWSKK
jgi:hypothetical protein